MRISDWSSDVCSSDLVVFFFGALSVFDREIDRWAIPASRFDAQPMPSFDTVLRPVFETMQPSADRIERMRDKVNGPLPERFTAIGRAAGREKSGLYV